MCRDFFLGFAQTHQRLRLWTPFQNAFFKGILGKIELLVFRTKAKAKSTLRKKSAFKLKNNSLFFSPERLVKGVSIKYLPARPQSFLEFLEPFFQKRF